MTSKMNTVSIAVTAHMLVGGQTFDLTTVDTTMISQGLSRALVRPATGLKASKAGGRSSAKLAFARGTPAQVYLDVKQDSIDPLSGAVLLRAGQHLAFDGFYDDAGPSDLANGSFTMQTQLVSKYAQLDTGALQYAQLFPNSFLDSTVPINPLGVAGQAPGKNFDSQLIAQDFWSALVDVMHNIATGGALVASRPSLQEYIQVFGDDVNKAADAILTAIKGTLIGGPMANPLFAQSVQRYLNVLFTQDMRYQSFFHRLVALGQEFKYRLMEHPLGLAAVPYSPFFAKPKNTISPSSLYSVNWTVNNPGNCLGLALTRAGTGALSASVQTTFLLGAFKRTGYKSVLGTVTSLPCPPWMLATSPLDTSTQFPVFGLDTRTIIGDPYAKELALEYAYVGRSVQAACPLRMDIGPLTAVEIRYPKLPGIDLGTSIFGSVQMVKLMIDASARKAVTVMEVGFVRSQIQQEAEFSDYKHPLWTSQYMGGRLDEQPVV